LWASSLSTTNDKLDHGTHRHHPPLALPNLQVKAAAMEAEVEAVNDGNRNRGGGSGDSNSGSGGGKK
jgi:hypothetical protein